MPADFLQCVKAGGKVRTKTLTGGKFMRLCKDKKGKWHAGEVQTKADVVSAFAKYAKKVKSGKTHH